MMRRFAQAARAEAAQSERGGSEIPIPLPIKGLYDSAKRSEVNGILASVLHNWKCTSTGMDFREGFRQLSGDSYVIRRIPYDFGLNPEMIEVMDVGLRFRGRTFYRNNARPISHTSISANVIMANGAGPISRCDGETIVDAGFTIATGKSPSELNRVFSHHDRIYAWDDKELDFYYGKEVGAVMGELVRYPLSRLGNIKGRIVGMASMTVNAAQGMSDMLVIITSAGTVLIYNGIDPGDVTDWGLIGRLDLKAEPIGQAAMENFGPDLWVLTRRGIASIRDSLSQGALAMPKSVGRPISDDIQADVDKYGNLDGWQMLTIAETAQVVVHVPSPQPKQYLFAVEEEAWTTADYPARSWHVADLKTGFTRHGGSLNQIGGDDDAGTPIKAVWHSSWLRVGGARALQAILPTIIGHGDTRIRFTALTDHDETPEDVQRGTQDIILRPDKPGDYVALNEIFPVGAAGRVFQTRWEIIGKRISFENLQGFIQ